ncbi:HNH endonuclease signature motif containing protein [Gordonia sp. PKS22-38]|uniref:HNH endonuclease signature motif containing protein n=1 Tax=Gordonia prachuapensis TaxID=3115651 RepID=A0ABU7MXA9_9ACTN|nr:HNH endonuclease signature motif containing protein [Gordonia sp. PKS22-38]
MAELGETSDPKALIPGDADAIDENAVAIGGRGNSMALAGLALRGINTGDYWDGEGAEAFREVFKQEPVKWLEAADAFINTGRTLGQYAGVVRWAQSEAQGAIDMYDEAQRATAQAVTDYNNAVISANASNTANAAAGSPVRVTVPPFDDPGIEGRAAAQAKLTHARQQLRDAGDTAADNVRSQLEKAPEGPEKRSGIWDYIKEFGGGLGDWVTGSWDALKTIFTTNPIDSATGIWNAISQDPKQFGKDLIDWDTWAENPARAAGRVVPDAILTVATAGAGSVARRGAVESVEAGADVADSASHAVPNGPTLQMKYKDTWTDAQRAEMDRKIDSFNEKVKESGFERQPGPFVRDPKVREEFLESQGLTRPPTGLQVDHVRDLQAGGVDEVSNLQLLDGSVNTSFGSQLRNLMSQQPPGTVFGAVEMLRE